MAQTLPTQQVPRVTQLSHMATLGQPWEADILGPISLRFHVEVMSLAWQSLTGQDAIFISSFSWPVGLRWLPRDADVLPMITFSSQELKGRGEQGRHPLPFS